MIYWRLSRISASDSQVMPSPLPLQYRLRLLSSCQSPRPVLRKQGLLPFPFLPLPQKEKVEDDDGNDANRAPKRWAVVRIMHIGSCFNVKKVVSCHPGSMICANVWNPHVLVESSYAHLMVERLKMAGDGLGYHFGTSKGTPSTVRKLQLESKNGVLCTNKWEAISAISVWFKGTCGGPGIPPFLVQVWTFPPSFPWTNSRRLSTVKDMAELSSQNCKLDL